MHAMNRVSLALPAVLLSSSLLLLPGTALLADAIDSSADSCIPEKEQPPLPPDVPENIDELCETDFGAPTPADLYPPDLVSEEEQNGYAERVQRFLRRFEYRELGWRHDPRWRLTGEYAGCPESGKSYWTNETHPLVKIYYSREVMEWLCKFRRDPTSTAGEGEMPRGAMIVKEMHSSAVDAGEPQVLAYRPDTGTPDAFGKLWVDADFTNGLSWTVMIKGADTGDGWYWGGFSSRPSSYADDARTYNPPILDRSGFSTPVDPHTQFPIAVGADGKPLPDQVPPPEGPWYPTYWSYSVPDVVFPNYAEGYYCIYCHGSAVSESTFSSLDNLIGGEIEFDYLKEEPAPAGPTPIVGDHDRLGSIPLTPLKTSAANPRSPFPPYNPLNIEEFEATYPQFSGLTFDDVWPHRLPSQSWDHAPTAADGSELYLTSDQCIGCHGAGGASQRVPNMVVVKDTTDEEQVDLTPYAEWSASPMGLAGRDPIFYAMLESELNRADREPGLKPDIRCIQNTCLHCHGNMGQRQWALERPGDDCADFEPITDPTSGGTWTPEEARKSGYGGQAYLREYLATWPGHDAAKAKFGGLSRDGISCTTCHHMSAEDLGKSGKTFTGNFREGPEDVIFGPFETNIATEPMKLSLGITPEFSDHLTKSELCGSCHAIYLPVFDNQGNLRPGKPAGFEQTTYLEWLNSAYNIENDNFPPRVWRTCQECHMRDDFVYVDDHGDLVTVTLAKERIANVEDETFPDADFRQDLNLEYRDYKRHTFYGLNVFLNAFFQQFPLLLGVWQQDYMDPSVTAPQLTAREEALLIARYATARIDVHDVTIDSSKNELKADVTVTSQAGHKLPSGVGFRRAFIEFQVLDASGKAIWASGRTSDVGVLQNGLEDQDLPSEFLQAAPNTACPLPYQPHHQEITQPCQVQIYEELAQDSDHRFTTSFIHRYYHVKDNRLLPKGYRTVGEDNQPAYCAPWCSEPNPDGRAKDDPDYNGTGPHGVAGKDSLIYRISLTPEQLARVATVRATLYSQATAPYFLHQRFEDGQAGPRDIDSKRLYFLNGHLNTQARAQDGRPYIDQYKLRLYQDSEPVK